MTSEDAPPALFNSSLEAGIRAVVILDAFAPSAFDIATLSLLDYYLVHAGDAGARDSVHPDLEAREGEYFVRRRLVEEGTALMVRGFLVDRIHDDRGISFRAHEIAGAMVSLMNTPYNKRLKEAAEWLAERAEEQGLEKFLVELRTGIDRWTLEIIGDQQQ
ncbi:ABC-three component system middle component 2 [Neorhizobium sp. T25_27]|uniref:ABC-three component system middle component 2 n=1 Tax=Neorhizobium sp. T25_27 TaxID=2093831 RepID=UPI000CF9C035|nr:ABC-three component system middle component 2 [Neorhizobium sp. T25_27]